MAAEESTVETPRVWSRLRQDIGVIVWSGFLAACFATLLFFALFDPALLMHDDSPPQWLADRRSGYTVGFFFFWVTAMIAAALATWLVDTRNSNAVARTDGP